MKKLMLILVISAVTFSLSTQLSLAQEATTPVKTSSEKPAAVNVGNNICPVSGEKVGQGGMEPATYEYEGKIYNFCCQMCITSFKKDPQKYIKIIEEELKSKDKANTQGVQGNMHGNMH